MLSHIDVGRIRILGGGGARGSNSQQAHDVVTTRCDVTTSHRRHFDVMCPQGFKINQCQIVTLLILKFDIIENSRIE